jgi:hypothetical protein
MPDPNTRPGDAPQPTAAPPAAEPVRMGRDDPAAPSPQQQAEAAPTPPPRRDNQAEAIAGVPIV